MSTLEWAERLAVVADEAEARLLLAANARPMLETLRASLQALVMYREVCGCLDGGCPLCAEATRILETEVEER